ncbi:hypothetical protein [Neomoorella glycerini]|uniref:hypothetical protein n=1 Tax=Neomoorella glycerini TaxID=55779 RepID=UPI003BF5CF50
MGWIRRRLRMKQMRDWKSWKALHKALRRRGYEVIKRNLENIHAKMEDTSHGRVSRDTPRRKGKQRDRPALKAIWQGLLYVIKTTYLL